MMLEARVESLWQKDAKGVSFQVNLGMKKDAKLLNKGFSTWAKGWRGSKWSRSGAYENVSPVQLVSSSHDHREWSFVILVLSQDQGWFWSNSFNHQLQEEKCYTSLHLAEIEPLHDLQQKLPKWTLWQWDQHKLNILVHLPAPFKAPWKGLGSQGLHGPNGIRPHGSKLTRAMGKLALGIVASPADETDGSTDFQPSPDPSPVSPVSPVSPGPTKVIVAHLCFCQIWHWQQLFFSVSKGTICTW